MFTCVFPQDCAAFEKCCTNVCGLLSCVASRFSEGFSDDGQSGAGGEASCAGFECGQQGAVCKPWEGQPVCKCQDHCESEPSFTCASDGLTYFNRCYMDAEACVQGVTLTEVTCRYHLPGPKASPCHRTPRLSPWPPAPSPSRRCSTPAHSSRWCTLAARPASNVMPSDTRGPTSPGRSSPRKES